MVVGGPFLNTSEPNLRGGGNVRPAPCHRLLKRERSTIGRERAHVAYCRTRLGSDKLYGPC